MILGQRLAAVAAELEAMLGQAGWSPRPAEDGADNVGAEHGLVCVFERPLQNRFRALAIFGWEQAAPGRLRVRGYRGLQHDGARDLVLHLIGADVPGIVIIPLRVEVNIISIRQGSDAAELASLVDDEGTDTFLEAATVDSVAQLLKDGQGIPFTGDPADIEWGDPLYLAHCAAIFIAAMFASTGRPEDAKAALDENQVLGSARGWEPREYRRLARQMERYLAAGENARLPSSPARWPDREPGSARLGINRIPPVPQRQQPALSSSPDSLPECASYPIVGYPLTGRTAKRVEVELEPSASEALRGLVPEQCAASLTSVLIEVWLSFDKQPERTPRRLAVNIGAKTVGWLPPDVSDRLAGAVAAARDRDEAPWMHAFIDKEPSSSFFRLTISLPAEEI
jgi:hypothetical protein